VFARDYHVYDVVVSSYQLVVSLRYPTTADELYQRHAFVKNSRSLSGRLYIGFVCHGKCSRHRR